jgi:hypothetical protein
MVSAGRFESEDALRHYLLDPFPWLLMVVYENDIKHRFTAQESPAPEAQAGAATTTNPLGGVVSMPMVVDSTGSDVTPGGPAYLGVDAACRQLVDAVGEVTAL